TRANTAAASAATAATAGEAEVVQGQALLEARKDRNQGRAEGEAASEPEQDRVGAGVVAEGQLQPGPPGDFQRAGALQPRNLVVGNDPADRHAGGEGGKGEETPHILA